MFQSPTIIRKSETVLFFPSYAYRSPDRTHWHLNVHGWIFIAKERSLMRNGLVGLLSRGLQMDDEEAQSPLFQQRARAFLVDNKRGKRISIRLGERSFELPRSEKNGHFRETVLLPAEEFDELRNNSSQSSKRLQFQAITEQSDPREFHGSIEPIDETGISVITDIDDTIKLTNVADRRELLMNTFLRKFRAVDAMSSVFRRLADQGAAFHYVSSSPWQLYEPLKALFSEEGFPLGSFHLRNFRLKERSTLEHLSGSETQKREAIEDILTTFPERKFIFFGDSGERDPEMYASLAERFSGQVVRVCIRNSSGESADSDRFRQVFLNLPDELWTLFDHAEQLLKNEGRFLPA